MNYTQEREAFIAKVTNEGLPITVIRTILAKANALQRIAELQCSSALADRDRVKCPGDPSRKSGKGECICDSVGNRSTCSNCDQEIEWNGAEWSDRGADTCCGPDYIKPHQTADSHHSTVPRIDVQEAHIKRQLDKLMAGRNGFRLNYQGDPRGAVVKLALPSGAYDDVNKDGLCVPAKGLPARYWEQEERIMAGIYQMEARQSA